jgi:hypothetical protein
MDAEAPAGSYKLALEEESLDTPTVEAWRQTAAILQITTGGITEHVSVDPQALRDALLHDGDDSAGPVLQSTRTILGLRRR